MRQRVVQLAVATADGAFELMPRVLQDVSERKIRTKYSIQQKTYHQKLPGRVAGGEKLEDGQVAILDGHTKLQSVDLTC